jgi:hypothetical protein
VLKAHSFVELFQNEPPYFATTVDYERKFITAVTYDNKQLILITTVSYSHKLFIRFAADLKNELVPTNERQDHLRFWPSVATLSAVRPKL